MRGPRSRKVGKEGDYTKRYTTVSSRMILQLRWAELKTILRGIVTKTLPVNYNIYRERGEPKRNQTEVLLLTSLKPYCWAKPAHGLW